MNKRKAAIGYATYVVAGRVARTVVGRRRARRSMRTRMGDAMRPRRTRPRRTRLPLVGGAAAAVAGAAVIAHHRRRNGSHDPD
jgi:hypothetical protein